MLKVVYIDDEPELLELFADDFASESVEVRTFSNAKAAIEDIAKDPPDLVFIDLQLPDANGEEIAKALDPGIPKVLMTGNLGYQENPSFIRILSKPAVFAEIKALIGQFAAAKKMRG